MATRIVTSLVWMVVGNVYVQSFCIVGVAILAGLLWSVLEAMRRTQLDHELPLLRKMQRALRENGGRRGRQWVEHPWRMIAIVVAIWLLGSLVLSARTFVYNR